MTVTIDSGWRTESVKPGAPLSAPKRPWIATSARTETRLMAMAALGMELLILLVVMHGITDLGIHVNVAHPVEDLDDLAMALTAVLTERQTQPVAEGG